MIAVTKSAWMAALLVAASLVAMWAAPTRRDDDCDLERTWYAGDVHFNEQLEFHYGGTGLWIASGFAGDATHARIAFRWEVDASQLLVTYDAGRRWSRVPFTIARRNNYCSLKFDAHPFLVDGGFTYFADFP